MSKLCGLNVVQLREELQKRSLVTSGNKEVLVARLREALIDEGKNPDEFKFGGADEDNEISTGTFTTAKMMELLLSMSTKMKQIKEQSERQTEELKHVKLEVAEQIEKQSTRIEMIEQKLDRQTVEFEAAATSNCWNGKERATALILALRGSAAEVLQTIPAENHFNYEVLVSALDLRYGEKHMKQIYRSRLRNRTQRSGESIQQLAQDIERLTLLSYPTPDPEHRDEIALDTFIKALRDSSNPLSCQINENLRMPLRTVSLLNRQSKHQKVTYVYANMVYPNAGFVVKKAIYVVIVNTA
ncbi:hypothetical protein HELRODRAFT_181166 [Helobdella robusta]|uniref:SAP domain-containing protein n=1 Tax=Helobdella robusta TaxID=6412 RepID=T1FGP7_HELRO|nr:hypothetical protein HELRODRAFT_181166 [Helobdella robusta]ESN93232.1 hypothetical protein HELRODRAFT_181166 [Helobdella robusta]